MPRGDYEGQKKNERMSKSSYDAKYPHNHVIVYESGHEIHIDNSPDGSDSGKKGARMRVAHRSGTYHEIDPDGKMRTVVVGNRQEYHKSGHTVTTDENGDFKTHGHVRENAEGGKHSTSKGDNHAVHGGDTLIVVGGNAKVAVAGDSYAGTKGNSYENVMGKKETKVAGTITTESGGENATKAPKISHN